GPAGRRAEGGRRRFPPLPPDGDARLQPAAGEVRLRGGGRRDPLGGPVAFGPAPGDGTPAFRRAGRSVRGQRPPYLPPDARLARPGAPHRTVVADAGDVVLPAEHRAAVGGRAVPAVREGIAAVGVSPAAGAPGRRRGGGRRSGAVAGHALA